MQCRLRPARMGLWRREERRRCVQSEGWTQTIPDIAHVHPPPPSLPNYDYTDLLQIRTGYIEEARVAGVFSDLEALCLPCRYDQRFCWLSGFSSRGAEGENPDLIPFELELEFVQSTMWTVKLTPPPKPPTPLAVLRTPILTRNDQPDSQKHRTVSISYTRMEPEGTCSPVGYMSALALHRTSPSLKAASELKTCWNTHKNMTLT